MSASVTECLREGDSSHSGHGFVPPTLAFFDQVDADARRRVSLETSDRLLDEIEELRLDDRKCLPWSLRDRIRVLYTAVTGLRTDANLKTCRAAHDLVFALQEPLLAANPRNTSQRRRSSHRVPGQSITVATPVGGAWKLLSLPAEPLGGLTEEWFVLATATIERAWERWAYAQHHAIAAARRRSRHSRQAVAQTTGCLEQLFGSSSAR